MKSDGKGTHNHHALHILALLGAMTGATLITPGSAMAAPPRLTCDDAIPNRANYDGSRCAYSERLLQAQSPETTPGPDPTPPYTP